MTNQNYKFKVGDKVSWCGVEGEVIKVCDGDVYPIIVNLIGRVAMHMFTHDGKYFDWHKEPSLKLIEPAKQIKEVYQWRCWVKKDSCWRVDPVLLDKKQAKEQYEGRRYEAHMGPFQVEV